MIGSSRSFFVVLVLSMLSATTSFTHPATGLSKASRIASSSPPFRRPSRSTQMNSSSGDDEVKEKNNGMEEGMRTKLLSESIAPWRSLRLFLYGALGSGAFIGGLVTLSGFLGAMSAGREVDVNTEYLNLAIDFGAVVFFAVLAKLDLDKQKELDERVEQRIEKKKDRKKVAKGMKERETLLGTLKLQIQVSAAGDTRDAAVKELQAGARQHMIVVAGPKKACRDALVGANLLKLDFAMSNVLVVPYETDAKNRGTRPDGGGFGDLPAYETQPYVARPVGDGWDDYIKAEMEDAVTQSGEQCKEEGIAIVVASNGKVIRRGVGKVPWRQMVESLDESLKQSSKSQSR